MSFRSIQNASLDDRERHLAVHSQDHPDEAASYLNIGNVYKDQGDYENALSIYQTALQVFLAVHGQDHPDAATSKFNLAIFQKKQDEIDVTRTLFRESKQTFTRVVGPDHPQTLMSARGASECV